MLQKTVNSFIYLIALVIVVAACVFALIRSAPVEPPHDAVDQTAESLSDAPGNVAGEPEWYALGQRMYVSECSGCHPSGADLSDAFSSIASPEGRKRVIDLMLHGIEGHPEYSALTDRELAAILNYGATEWSGRSVTPVELSEVAARR